MPDLIENREAILRTSFFGGFQKQEVLAYIDRLREENAAAQASLEQQLRSVSDARNELSDQVGSFERKIAEMEKQLEERSAHVRELTGQVSILKSQLLTSKKAQDETARSLQAQEKQNRLLIERLQDSEEKARSYEMLSDKVGEVLISAHREAETVVGEAREKAREIRNCVAADGRRMSDELDDLRMELTQIREQMQALAGRLDSRTQAVNRLLEAIDTAGPLPQRDAPAVEGAAKSGETAQPAVSKTARRIFDAAGAMRADAAESQ